MPGRTTSRGLVVLFAVAALCAEALQHTTGLDVGLLHLAPALVLLVPLLAGRYVGEERIAALADARAVRRPRVVAQLALPPSHAPRVLMARGGALLAAWLAERGPPVAPVAR